MTSSPNPRITAYSFLVQRRLVFHQSKFVILRRSSFPRPRLQILLVVELVLVIIRAYLKYLSISHRRRFFVLVEISILRFFLSITRLSKSILDGPGSISFSWEYFVPFAISVSVLYRFVILMIVVRWSMIVPRTGNVFSSVLTIFRCTVIVILFLLVVDFVPGESGKLRKRKQRDCVAVPPFRLQGLAIVPPFAD